MTIYTARTALQADACIPMACQTRQRSFLWRNRMFTDTVRSKN